MTHSLLGPGSHSPLSEAGSLAELELPDRTLLGQKLNLEDRLQVLLLGADRSISLIRDALSGISDWELPLLEVEVSGATAVWASDFSAGGTPTATLQGEGRCKATMALVDQTQLSCLQIASPKSHQTVRLTDCKAQSGPLEFNQPLVHTSLEGVMPFDGSPRAVAVNAVPGGPPALMMIEVAEWICELARRSGIDIDGPQDLQRACSQSSLRAELISLLQPGLPHNLDFSTL